MEARMGPFWGTFFENIRERGRNGMLFLIALAALVGVLVLSGLAETVAHGINAEGFASLVLGLLTVVGCFAGVRIAVRIRQRLRVRRTAQTHLRLSSDELAKARSKLKKR